MTRLRLATPAQIATVAALLTALVGLPAAHAEIGRTRALGPAPTIEKKKRDFASPQWFAFELKFGPYSPEIDSAPGVGAPYAELFGSVQTKDGVTSLKQPKAQLLTEIEFDVQLLKKVGTLGLGLNVGFFRNSAKGFRYPDGMGNASCDPLVGAGCTRSGDRTALNVLPVALLAVYRFDYLAKRWRVPLVPYAKIGLGYAFWWIEGGGGARDIATANIGGKTQKGAGGTWGWTARPGLAFQLDVIDPPTARTMDSELGINHAYLFAELNYMDYSGFGQKNRMRLTDLTYSIGLAFEF